MKTRHTFAAFLAAMSLTAHAEINPPRGVADPRVRVVEYDVHNVVKLTTFYGVSTHVQLGAGEVVKALALGDKDAWDVQAREGRHIFIKPRAHKADTNLTVLTDKRVYHFALVVQPRSPRDAGAWKDHNLVYSVSFRYPIDESRTEQARSLAALQRAEGDAIRSSLQTPHAGPSNFDYWVAGSEDISPTAARDDGRFIYLGFGQNRDMPAVYAVAADGTESLVNTTVNGNEIVVHRMTAQLRLRKGNAVACVVNKSFDINGGIDNTSGTVSPAVQRVIRKEDDGTH